MREWVEGFVPANYAVPAMAIAAALVALILLYIVIRIVRHYSAGTYVAGGRNRKTRLAVMDATAIDNHRRLVLVRRDDVEHLILIGGAADVVVERDIRLAGQVRRPTTHADAMVEPALAIEPAPVARPVQSPRPAPTAPRPAATAPAMPNVTPLPRPVPPPPPPVMRPAPPVTRAPAPAVAPVKTVMPTAKTLEQDFDDELMRELEVELDGDRPSPPAKAPAISLDDEMTRLLGELSSHKR